MPPSLASRLRVPCLALLALAMAGCRPGDPLPVPAANPTRPPLQVESWLLPTTAEAAQPDLVLAPSGEILLSWLEPYAGGHRLQLSRSTLEAVGAADWHTTTIAEGDDWFVNWADTPHVWALPDGSLWAHWLRSTGPGRMDYGIDLVRSGDRGATWSEPRLVNLPGALSDHGFVTFWTHSHDQLGIAWLDSRQKGVTAAAAKDDAHHAGGPMMLRAGIYDASTAPLADWPLDGSVCDCCSTASAMTSSGPVVVYRGRSAGEVRDLRIVRLEGGTWTTPRSVHDDGWKIPGCPVNGPAVQAHGQQVWVAWYTEGSGAPSVRLARSTDAGQHFDAPLELEAGAYVLGRVRLALSGPFVLALWLEQVGDVQRLVLARLAQDLSTQERVTVATLQARGRASGNPRLVADQHGAWMVWVDVDAARPVLRGARVRWPNGTLAAPMLGSPQFKAEPRT